MERASWLKTVERNSTKHADEMILSLMKLTYWKKENCAVTTLN
jgi:hypothetical protein